MTRSVISSGEFLFGDTLSQRMREVAGGRKVRVAVAFWTEMGVREIFPEGVPKNAQIVCDISMRSTSAEALEALNAPGNPNLKHCLAMHSKIVLSDRGLVVGSANATGAALGARGGAPLNVETGAFHTAESPACEAAKRWFKGLFRKAHAVAQPEVDWARATFRVDVAPLPAPPTGGSLLEMVRAAPERFASVGFVFASTKTERDARSRILAAAAAMDPHVCSQFGDDWTDGVFGGWGEKKAKRWPSYFFEFWQPKSRLHVLARRLEARVPDEGGVLAVRDWIGMRALIGAPLPSLSLCSRVDRALALKVRGGGARFFGSGPELADRLAKLDA